MQLSDKYKYRFSLWHLADKMKTALAAAVLKSREISRLTPPLRSDWQIELIFVICPSFLTAFKVVYSNNYQTFSGKYWWS